MPARCSAASSPCHPSASSSSPSISSSSSTAHTASAAGAAAEEAASRRGEAAGEAAALPARAAKPSSGPSCERPCRQCTPTTSEPQAASPPTTTCGRAPHARVEGRERGVSCGLGAGWPQQTRSGARGARCTDLGEGWRPAHHHEGGGVVGLAGGGTGAGCGRCQRRGWRGSRGRLRCSACVRGGGPGGRGGRAHGCAQHSVGQALALQPRSVPQGDELRSASEAASTHTLKAPPALRRLPACAPLVWGGTRCPLRASARP